MHTENDADDAIRTLLLEKEEGGKENVLPV